MSDCDCDALNKQIVNLREANKQLGVDKQDALNLARQRGTELGAVQSDLNAANSKIANLEKQVKDLHTQGTISANNLMDCQAKLRAAQATPPVVQSKDSNKTMLYVMIGVGVLVAVVAGLIIGGVI